MSYLDYFGVFLCAGDPEEFNMDLAASLPPKRVGGGK